MQIIKYGFGYGAQILFIWTRSYKDVRVLDDVRQVAVCNDALRLNALQRCNHET